MTSSSDTSRAVAVRVANRAVELRGTGIQQDDDFEDLEPLADVLRDVAVVMLGEYDHGDGASFIAKARLVTFLHQRLGCDVVAWECGVYDMRRVAGAIAEGEPARDAQQRGMQGVWVVEEVLPVLDYAASKGIAVEGFDCQLTSGLSFDEFADYAKETLAGTLHDVSAADWQTLDAFVRSLRWDRPHLVGAERAKARDLVSVLGAAVENAAGADEAWLARSIRGLLAFDDAMSAPDPSLGRDEYRAFLRAHNGRDEAMARNLLDILAEHSGRTVVVWASTFHIARNLRLVPGMARGVVTMGDTVSRELGERAYTIAPVSYRGTRRSWMAPGPDITIGPAPRGTLELELHELGLTRAFVDLRELRGQTFTCQAIGGDHAELAWGEVVDGALFIDEMTPSTPIPASRKLKETWKDSQGWLRR